MREIYNMNFDWEFHDGEIACPNFHSVHDNFEYPVLMKSANCGIAKVGYDRYDWKKVQLPHDLRHDKCQFDQSVSGNQGYLVTGIGWYRKEFYIDEAVEGKSIQIAFDGVFRDSEVYVNGSFVGRHMSGYTGFCYDITDFILCGCNNAIAVRVDGTKFEGWWYEAAGIYRDVHLIITDRVHVKSDGVYINYTMDKEDAILSVSAEIENESMKEGKVQVELEIMSPDGEKVIEQIKEIYIESYHESKAIFGCTIKKACVWDLSSTKQYVAKIKLFYQNKIIDDYTQKFGVRTIEYSADHGIILNGRHIKIKGVCVHDDFAGVGGAMSRSVIRHKIYLLKQMGCTGYRCSHNPPSPYVLEACDDFGILVMDEMRMLNSSSEFMKQMTDTIKRDRNHPSVFLWSLGNEEMAIHGTKLGVQITNHMLDIAHRLDQLRPCTYANNCNWKEIAVFHEEHGLHMDVFGFNYDCLRQFDSYQFIKDKYPDRAMIGSENGGALSTRGQYLKREEELSFSKEFEDKIVWSNPQRKYNVSAYGEAYPVWSCTPTELLKSTDPDYVSGYFIWTGFDYRGEISPMSWPSVISRYGINDLCGFMKDTGHIYRVKWSNQPTVYVYPHWTFDPSIGEIEVDIVANTEEVELLINGISQGRYPNPDRELVKYQVTYEPGELKAVGYNQGMEVATMIHHTAKEPVKVAMHIIQDREYVANGEDCIFLKVEVLDEDRIHCPNASNLIEFQVEGEGTFLGAGNGDPISMANDKEPNRNLFNGLALAIIRTTRNLGTIKVVASSQGLEPTSLEIPVTIPAEDQLVSNPRDVKEELPIAEKDAADGAF